MDSKGKKERKSEQKPAGVGRSDGGEGIQHNTGEFHLRLESLGRGEPLNTCLILFSLKENSFALPKLFCGPFPVHFSQRFSSKGCVSSSQEFPFRQRCAEVLRLTQQLPRDLWEFLEKCVSSHPWSDPDLPKARLPSRACGWQARRSWEDIEAFTVHLFMNEKGHFSCPCIP